MSWLSSQINKLIHLVPTSICKKSLQSTIADVPSEPAKASESINSSLNEAEKVKLMVYSYIDCIQQLLTENNQIIPSEIYTLCLIFYSHKHWLKMDKNKNLVHKIPQNMQNFFIYNGERKTKSRTINQQDIEVLKQKWYHHTENILDTSQSLSMDHIISTNTRYNDVQLQD